MFLHLLHFKLTISLLVTWPRPKNMYVLSYLTVPAEMYGTETFFCENLQKIMKDLYWLT